MAENIEAILSDSRIFVAEVRGEWDEELDQCSVGGRH